jgi:hypothetical protein
MGTSSSFRAPNRPKWNAFNAALAGGESVGRVVSEMFNAGEEWEDALSSPAIAVFAEATAGLFDDLPALLGEGQPAETIVQRIADGAMAASMNAGFSPAFSMAQRTLVRVLVRHLDGLSEGSTADLTNRWLQGRGASPGSLAADYLSELTTQFARYAVDREAGRLSITVRQWSPEIQRALSESVSSTAGALSRRIALEMFGSSKPNPRSWSSVVHRVFDAGREIPSGATGG